MPVAENIAHLRAATDRLAATVENLSDAQLSEPSALPGWTRAHLLCHLARNADGMRNMLLGARTGVDVPMYPSLAMRAADIEAGATRPSDVIRSDVVAAAERYVVEAAALPGDAWDASVFMGALDMPGRSTTVAASTLWGRLREVEIHHGDLDAGYSFGSTPPALLSALLDDVVSRLQGNDGLSCELVCTDSGRSLAIGSGVTKVSGAESAMFGWLQRRSDGSDLLVADGSALPEVPSI